MFATWDLYLYEDDATPAMENYETEMPKWADVESNAENFAATIVDWELNCSEWWGEWFGDDVREGTVYLHIKAPPRLAGRYDVSVERRFVTIAEKLPAELEAAE